ncbi:B3/4 domain-containing protein [Bacillus inaquosorum]|uniref:B3/B4 domain-containing protein n=1 Tax=Bacillus inaquosorum TaxID=483913 RepID=UPI0022804ED2|nr:B3/4 domain-containing protein [Bacillus inaquosorum]MCY9060233.1 B3/4 domain-containing protein [Bacillus inaquosorum]
MNIKLDSVITERAAGLQAAAVFYKNIEVSSSPQMLKGRLRLFQESLFFDYADGGISDESFAKEWQELFKQLNPSFEGETTPMEDMLIPISKEQFMESKDSAHDTIDFFSLKYSLPIMIYDAGKLHEPVRISLGEKENILLFSDENGIFGDFKNSVNRCPVIDETKSMLQIIFFPPSIEKNSAVKLLSSLTKMFEQIHGGSHTVHWLT